MERRKSNKHTRTIKASHKTAITSEEYSWHLAQSAGMVPSTARQQFERHRSDYFDPIQTGNGASKSDKRSAVRRNRAAVFVMLLVICVGVQVWLSIIAELMRAGFNNGPDLENIITLGGADSYQFIIAVNGIVVTAIALWLALAESKNTRWDSLIGAVDSAKREVLKHFSSFLKSTPKGLEVKRSVLKVEKSNSNNVVRITRIPQRINVNRISEDLKKVEVRSAEIDLITGSTLCIVIALSASLATVGTIAELFRHWNDPQCSKIGLIAFWIWVLLIVLHWFLFSVVDRDLMSTRSALKTARLGVLSKRSMNYMMQLLSFSPRERPSRKTAIYYKFIQSNLFYTFGSCLLAVMLFLCFVPFERSHIDFSFQILIAATYVVVGILVPNWLLYFKVKENAFIASAIDTGLDHWLRRFFTVTCYAINMLVPAFCMLLLFHLSDYWWYLWWNPAFSACAFWFSRRLLFHLLSSDISLSASSFLAEIEHYASEELSHIKD